MTFSIDTFSINEFPIDAIRAQFPALQQPFDGAPAAFFDNPGGTQVPQRVIDAVTNCYVHANANKGGHFATSRRVDAIVAEARQACADLLNADVNEIVFGNNMTSLAFQLSRALEAEICAGDEIVVTRLDHDANVAPWLRLAEDTGATARFVDFDVETCTLDMEDMRNAIGERTKLVAVGCASNAVGTVNDVATVVQWAREAGALSFIDAVQWAPHGPIDVRALDCDFLACSAYKFFGPHVGVLYGKRAHLARLRSHNVRPAGESAPGTWETGTKNHEGIAGTGAAIDYLASIGSEQGGAGANGADASRRERLLAAWSLIGDYERALTRRLIAGLESIRGVEVYGLTDASDEARRVATVAARKRGVAPEALARALGDANIFAWNGDFYAVSAIERLGLDDKGGVLRLGLAHYNTAAEVDRCLAVIDETVK